MRAPVAATMPNITRPAPPSTTCGTASTRAAIFGRKPSASMMQPPAAVTQRERMPVTPTRPTFCENDVYGKVLKMPPMMVPMPSARRPRARSLPVDLAPGHFAEREEHADGFDHHHDHHDAHGDDRHQMELRHAEPQWRDHVDPGRGAHLGEGHHAEGRRQYRAGDDAEQHRDVGDEARAPPDQREDHHQHEQRDAEPLKLSVAGIGERAGDAVDHLGEGRQAAARPVDADPHQRDADHHDDGAGNHWRKKRQKPAYEGSNEKGEQAGGDHRAVYPEQADIGGRRHRQHGPDRGEGDAHHDRQADADTGKTDALHQGGDAAGEQVGADQEGDVLRRHLEGTAENQRHRNRARIHHQHMLKPQGQQLRYREELIDGVGIAAHQDLSPTSMIPKGFRLFGWRSCSRSSARRWRDLLKNYANFAAALASGMPRNASSSIRADY